MVSNASQGIDLLPFPFQREDPTAAATTMPPKKDPKIAERIAELEDGIGALTGTRWADADDATTESDSDLSVGTQIPNVRTLPNRFAVSAITQPCRGVAASI
jgi:hypothetical protein